MRNPARIEPLLDQIRTIWLKHPDLRLGQLILNCVEMDQELYYMEDSKLPSRLAAVYGTDGELLSPY